MNYNPLSQLQNCGIVLIFPLLRPISEASTVTLRYNRFAQPQPIRTADDASPRDVIRLLANHSMPTFSLARGGLRAIGREARAIGDGARVGAGGDVRAAGSGRGRLRARRRFRGPLSSSPRARRRAACPRRWPTCPATAPSAPSATPRAIRRVGPATSRAWTWPTAAFRSVACPPRRPRATARRRFPWRP